MPDTLDKDKSGVEAGSHDNLGVHPEHREAEVDDFNRRFYGPSATNQAYDQPGTQDSAPIDDLEKSFGMPSYAPDHEKGGDLGSKEEEAGKGPGSSLDAGKIAGKAADVVGKGFNPEAASVGAALHGIQKAKDMLWGGKKQKRRTLISGGVIGTVVAIVTILIALFLPNTVVSIMSDLENRVFAVAEHELDKALQQEMQHFLKNEVFGSTNECGPTKNPAKFYKCIKKLRADKQKSNDKTAAEDPIEGKGGLADAWVNSDLTGQFAEKGITFSEEGGKYYINSADLEGGKLDVSDFVKGDKDLFELMGEKAPAFVATFKSAMDALVVIKGSFLHVVFAKLLAYLYGVRWCIMDCSPGNEEQNRAGDTTADKQNFSEAVVEEREIEPTAAVEGQMVQDVAAGDDPANREAGTGTGASDIASGDMTSGGEKAAEALDQAATKFGSRKLATLIKSFNDLKAAGSNYITEAVAKALSGVLGEDIGTESVKEAFTGILKFVNVVGWVQVIIQFVHLLLNAGQTIPYAYNLIHSTAEVTLFAAFATTAAEQKSGHNHPDFTMLGSMAKLLSAHDKSGNPSSALQSPLLQRLINRNSTKYSDNQVHSYLEDGHFALDGGSKEGVVKASKGLNQFPGLSFVVNLINTAFNIILGPIQDALGFLLNQLGVASIIGKVVAPLMGWVSQQLFTMFDMTHMSGEDAGTVVAMGGDISGNQAVRSMGGKVDGQAAAVALAEQQNEDQQQFESRPLFARMFATDTPYSFVSQLSLKMPLSFGTAIQTSFAGLIENPLGKLFGSFASVLHPGNAFADPTSTANVDVGGVEQYAIPDNDPVFQGDPETYWNTHDCEQQSKQDYPAWNKAVTFNTTTGQWEHTTTNGCLLIQRSAESAGVLFGGVQDGSQ